METLPILWGITAIVNRLFILSTYIKRGDNLDLNVYLKDKDDYKLCYVYGNFAYFTKLGLSKQWGDDWDDAPYEHNADEPYYEDPSQIIKVAFDDCGFETPADKTYPNSPYSVEMINSGSVAWLTGYDYYSKKTISIQAGCKLDEFIEKVKILEGNVYIPVT